MGSSFLIMPINNIVFQIYFNIILYSSSSSSKSASWSATGSISLYSCMEAIDLGGEKILF